MNRFAIKSFLLGLVGTAAIAQSPCFEANLGNVVGGGDDIVLPAQPIGFAFPFAGTNYSYVMPCTNGFAYLATGPNATGSALCCAGTTANLVAGLPMVAPYFTDLNMITANGAGVYVNNTNPTHCTITWHNAVEFGTTGQFELQCQLFANGDIKFSYGSALAHTTGNDVLVGMSPGGNAPVPAANDWTVPGAAGSTNYELFNTTSLPFDLVNQSVLMTATATGFVYVAVPILNCANTSNYGTGCVSIAGTSFYELFATGTLDLSNSSMSLIRSTSGYLALQLPTTFVVPSASAVVVAPGDDSETTVALSTAMPYGNNGITSNLTICSNGYVSTASGNGTGYTPASATFLAMPRTVWSAWHDYNPAASGSGQILFEEVAGIAYVTWNGVYDYGGTSSANANTFQMQFDLASGSVNVVWQTMSNLGNGHLVGFSEGGPSADPGSMDISAALPASFFAANFQIDPLAFAASSVPIFGTTIGLNTTLIPAGTPFGAVMVGLTNPALNLSGLGMPGCTQYTDGLAVLIYLPGGSSTSSLPYTVPGNAAYAGITLRTQSVAYAPSAGLTPLGAIASNGVNLVLGF